MTELVLVEGVSDVQLISHYLQNVYGWQHETENVLGITPLDNNEHIVLFNGNYLNVHRHFILTRSKKKWVRWLGMGIVDFALVALWVITTDLLVSIFVH